MPPATLRSAGSDSDASHRNLESWGSAEFSEVGAYTPIEWFFGYDYPRVKEVDAFAARAVAAGAKVMVPVADMFLGDRYGRLEDSFGHLWSVVTHVLGVTWEEMQHAMRKMGSQ